MAGPQSLEGGRLQVGIVVRDLDAMVAFYTDVLGLEHVGDIAIEARDGLLGGTLKMFSLGDASVKLLSLGEVPQLANPPDGVKGGASGLRYLTVAVDDVGRTVGSCEARGLPVPIPLFEYQPGMPIAVVEDPDGNWVELVQPVRRGA
jgi:catechol 2,3-dioxygenase-like lactoylglutathione lyase family enzyme